MTLATVLGNLLFDLREDRGLERARAFVNVRDLFRDGVLRPLDDDDSAAIVGLKTKRTTTTTTSEKGDYKLTVADDRIDLTELSTSTLERIKKELGP